MQQNITRIEKQHRLFNTKIKNHAKVKSTRQMGVIFALDLAIEMDRYGNLRDELFQFFMKKGVCLRPLGNTIYILPPFVITTAELQKIYSCIEEALQVFGA